MRETLEQAYAAGQRATTAAGVSQHVSSLDFSCHGFELAWTDQP